MSQEHLATYLNDHLAGSVGAIKLLEDLIEAKGDPSGLLTDLKSDIESDQHELKALIDRLDVRESRPRKAAAWIAGKLADVKSLVDDRATGALWRLEALEALTLGITGKLALWRSLAVAQEGALQLRGVDYQRLADRAEDQRRRAEAARLEAAREALG